MTDRRPSHFSGRPRRVVRFVAVALVTLSVGFVVAATPDARPNVLFIAADDLRTDLGCYGSREALTPQLDALARRGVLFERAYCQQAVCNPSRASVLTGRRPDTLKVWDLRTHFRQADPAIVTLPQYFKQHGYSAVGIGKLFHNESGAKPAFPFADPVSWSEPPTFANGAHWQDWVWPADATGPRAKGDAVQCLDVPDDAYFDGRIATAAIARLRQFAATREPFFLGVGFWKPHLPFNAPKKYWDRYDRAKLARPAPDRKPAGAPEFAGHSWTELRGYGGIPKTGPLSAAKIAELRHGYLAGISFLDAQVGRVLDELARLGLAEKTIVVFWSDHGFHLGEHDLWAKTTNYELDTRVPLIVVAPGVTGGVRAGGLVELLDLYPTLADLSGLPTPSGLEGVSLRPLLANPRASVKPAAFSQFPRPAAAAAAGGTMGYSMRTERFRYTEWRESRTGRTLAVELYDHAVDPGETVNLAAEARVAGEVRDLTDQLRRQFPPQPLPSSRAR